MVDSISLFRILEIVITMGSSAATSSTTQLQVPAATAAPVAAFTALAQSDRLGLFFHLVQDDSPLPEHELQRALRLPAPTLSQQLDQLERAGLSERVRSERCFLSSVRRDLVADLVRILTTCCRNHRGTSHGLLPTSILHNINIGQQRRARDQPVRPQGPCASPRPRPGGERHLLPPAVRHRAGQAPAGLCQIPPRLGTGEPRPLAGRHG